MLIELLFIEKSQFSFISPEELIFIKKKKHFLHDKNIAILPDFYHKKKNSTLFWYFIYLRSIYIAELIKIEIQIQWKYKRHKIKNQKKTSENSNNSM